MSETTLIASRRGSVTDWVPSVVTALGEGVAATYATDAPEDNQYYLPEGLLEEVVKTLEQTDCTRVVVDGHLHPGQAVDLQSRLPESIIRDRRQLIYERLASANPVAETKLEYERARIAYRAAEQRQRAAQARSPDGTSGRVADLEQQCENRRQALADRQQAARRRVETAHTDADAQVVILQQAGRPAAVSRRAIVDDEPTERDPAEDGLSPARPETDRTTIGPHDVAVTDVPGVCWTGDIPEWFEAVVPGTLAALRRADVILSTQSTADGLVECAAERFDVELVVVGPSDYSALASAVGDALPTVAIETTLPHSDEAQAAVSWLYDRTAVQDISYGDRIEVTVTASQTTADAVIRRLEAAGGHAEQYPSEKRDGQ